MWTYPRPSYPDQPSFEELSAVEINTQIHMVLYLEANPNPRAGPTPCKKWLPAPGLVCLDLFRWLTQSYLYITLTALHRVSGAPTVNHRAVKEWGDDTPNESGSTYKEEEEGEITSPPLSSSCKTPPPFSDIVGRQVGATVGEHHKNVPGQGPGHQRAHLGNSTSC
jgi:hypothetical protein